MLLPRDPEAWRSIRAGEKQRYDFPAGRYDFIDAVDPIVGEYRMCSLFSPALEFEDHAAADSWQNWRARRCSIQRMPLQAKQHRRMHPAGTTGADRAAGQRADEQARFPARPLPAHGRTQCSGKVSLIVRLGIEAQRIRSVDITSTRAPLPRAPDTGPASGRSGTHDPVAVFDLRARPGGSRRRSTRRGPRSRHRLRTGGTRAVRTCGARPSSSC